MMAEQPIALTFGKSTVNQDALRALLEEPQRTEYAVTITSKVRLPEPVITLRPSWLDWIVPGRRKRRQAEELAWAEWMENPMGTAVYYIPRAQLGRA